LGKKGLTAINLHWCIGQEKDEAVIWNRHEVILGGTPDNAAFLSKFLHQTLLAIAKECG